jgi:tetratricopeptide (TPR) repeat protein
MVEWEKSREAHFDSTEGYLLLGMYEDALIEIGKIIEKNSEDERALYIKGIILIQMKRYREAENEFNHLKDIKADNSDIYVHLAYIHRRTKGLDAAIETISSALKLNPHLAIANYNLACYYSVKKDIGNALKYLKMAIELSDEFADAAKTDEDFDSIKGDSGFITILKRRPSSKNEEN